MTDRLLIVPRKRARNGTFPQKPRNPSELAVVATSLSSPLAKDRFFRNLPRNLQTELDAISSPTIFRKREILFSEGELARGVFVIGMGSVKLSAGSPDGRSTIVRMAGPLEIVGLPGTMSGKHYEMTAEAAEAVQASFIPRRPFRFFVRAHGEVGLRVAEILSQIYLTTYREVRYLCLSGSAQGKLARFLLGLASNDRGRRPARVVLTLTHEEIAQVVGLSRETVTRLFADFRHKNLVEVNGSSLVIPNERALRDLIL